MSNSLQKTSIAVIIDPPTADAEGRRNIILRSVSANWLWYLLVLISGFLLPRFIDRKQGGELLGVWDLGWSLTVYISLLALGVASAVNRYVARYRALADWEGLNGTINSCLAVLMISAALGFIAAMGFAMCIPWLLPDAAPEFLQIGRWVIFLLSMSAAMQLPGGVFNGVITGYERFDILNLIRGATDVLVLVISIILLLSGYGLIVLACTNITGQVIGGIVKFQAARHICPQLRISPRQCSWNVIKEVTAFGGKTLLQGAATGGLYQLNGILVSMFLGPVSLAIYSRQRALVMHTSRFVKQYAQAFVPASSSLDACADHAALRHLMIQSTKYGLYVTLPIILMLLCLGGPLLDIWMGPQYKAPLVLAVLALGHLPSIAQLGVYSVLMGMARHGRPALYDVAAGAVGVITTLVLLSIFHGGILSAAIGLAIPVALSSGILMPLYACRVLNLRMRRYLGEILPGPILASIPFAICLLSGRIAFRDSPLVAVAVGLGSGGLITAIIYWLWVLPAPIRAAILRRL